MLEDREITNIENVCQKGQSNKKSGHIQLNKNLLQKIIIMAIAILLSHFFTTKK